MLGYISQLTEKMKKKQKLKRPRPRFKHGFERETQQFKIKQRKKRIVVKNMNKMENKRCNKQEQKEKT